MGGGGGHGLGGAVKFGSEDVELVTAFEQLGSGAIVWAVNCRLCGRTCRSILTTPGQRPRSWRCFPKCVDTPGDHVITAACVAVGQVYRVINPLNARTTDRKREAVRG